MTTLLYDASYIARRAYHNSAEFTTSDGKDSTLVWGILKDVWSIQKEFYDIDNNCYPEFFLIWDRGISMMRNAISGGFYKMNRRNAVEDMTNEEQRLHQKFYTLRNEAIEYFTEIKIPQVYMKGVEADDMLGIFKFLFSGSHNSVVIVTADLDIFQLIDEYTKIYKPCKFTRQHSTGTWELWGAEEFKLKYNIHPNRIADIKGIAGDKGDNIPGANRWGLKTAIKYLNEYGTIQNIFCHLDDLSASKRKGLEKFGLENVLKSRRLATIITDPSDKELRIDNNELTERISNALIFDQRIDASQFFNLLSRYELNTAQNKLGEFAEALRIELE